MTITTTPPPVRRGAKPAGGVPVKERPARGRTAAPRGTVPASRRGGTPTSARRPAPHAPRVPFAMLVIGLLGGALISLLMLRTVLAEDAFRLTKLQQNNRLLAQHEETLSQEVARAESPGEIARKARESGMGPAPGGFVNEATGQVRGATTTPSRPVTPGGGAVGTDDRQAASRDAGETTDTGATGTRQGDTTDGNTGGSPNQGAQDDGTAEEDAAIAGGGGR
ncbi:MAG: hypothetical protein GEV11_08905 [Streptosporangiales bacterium]|nr:hypothetical protein [Streptosporangiales bacterium]